MEDSHFNFVVVVFLWNAIFGIIFDTFGHLRDDMHIKQRLPNIWTCNLIFTH
ncbi:hypothetical protein BD408DRAFT_419824, partial [Parasitella parasitica]